MTELHVGEVLAPVRSRGTAAVTAQVADTSARVAPVLARTIARSHPAALLISELFTPFAVLALTLGLWRLGADLGWTGEFVIGRGLFSHWQVWIALAIGLRMAASLLVVPADKKKAG